MEKLFEFSKLKRLALLNFLFVLSLNEVAFGQTAPFPCPPRPKQELIRTSNPEFPGCRTSSGKSFKVLLVLDESYSIADAGQEPIVEAAVVDFANTLHANFSTPGKMEMGIMEFSDGAGDGVFMADVSSSSFTGTVGTYLSGGDGTAARNYDPGTGGETNFEAALNKEFPQDRKYAYENRGNLMLKVYSLEYTNRYNLMLNGKCKWPP